MSVLVNVRVPEHVRDTWKAEAEKLGVTLSDFVKGAVEARISGVRVVPSSAPPANPLITGGISYESQASIARPTPVGAKRSFKPDFKVPLVKKGKK